MHSPKGLLRTPY